MFKYDNRLFAVMLTTNGKKIIVFVDKIISVEEVTPYTCSILCEEWPTNIVFDISVDDFWKLLEGNNV